MEITTEYHSIWILGCAAFAGLLTLFSYFRNPGVAEMPSLWKRIAAFLRFAGVFLIAVLLLGIFLKSFVEEKERPTIVLAVDASSSMALSQDSGFSSEVIAQLTELQSALKADFDVKLVSFGNEIIQGFQEFNQPYTDFSQLSTYLDNTYEQTNLAAIAVFSDGVYNRGINPINYKSSLSAPIYTFGIGDSSVLKDAFIQKIDHNKIVFQGNLFPIRVDVRETGLAGEEFTLEVLQNNKVLKEQTVTFSNQSFVEFTLEAGTSGVQGYQVRIKPLRGESTTKNNIQSFFVDVMDQKFNVLLASQAPHPDVKAFRSVLEKSQDYEVTVSLLSDLEENLNKHSLIIVFGGKSSLSNSTLIKTLENGSAAVCFVVQPNIKRNDWNNLNLGMTINGERNQLENVNAFWNSDFSGFAIGQNELREMAKWSPIRLPFGKYEMAGDMEIVAFQEVNEINTGAPLLAYRKTKDSTIGFIIGEGYWRWRMLNYNNTGNFEDFDDLFSKFFRVLQLKEDKSRFKVEYPNIINENQELRFVGEVYDEAYELSTRFPVSLVLKDSSGAESNYEMLPSGNQYLLNLGRIEPGTYSFAALAGENKEFEKSGKIVVSGITAEVLNMRADFNMLEALSVKSGGKFFHDAPFSVLKGELAQRDDVKTIIHSKEEKSPLLNKAWPLVLAILLLGVEWFIRRWQGTY